VGAWVLAFPLRGLHFDDPFVRDKGVKIKRIGTA
jgi:hypothetical protein